MASQHLTFVLNIQHDNRLNDENKHLLMVRTDASCPIFSLYRPIVLHLTGTVKVDTRAQMTCENYSWSSSRTAADALVRTLGLLPSRPPAAPNCVASVLHWRLSAPAALPRPSSLELALPAALRSRSHWQTPARKRCMTERNLACLK